MPARKTPSTCRVTGAGENGFGKLTYANAPTSAANSAARPMFSTTSSPTRSTSCVSVLTATTRRAKRDVSLYPTHSSTGLNTSVDGLVERVVRQAVSDRLTGWDWDRSVLSPVHEGFFLGATV